jgi:hypothetical protein
MNLLNFYESLLKFAGLEASQDGYIRTSKLLSEVSEPILINGAQLVLPTQENLAHSDVSKRIIFHPLAESLTKKMPPNINRLMKVILRRLNMNIGQIGSAVIGSLVNVSSHHHFKGDQLELMKKLGEEPSFESSDLEVWRHVTSDALKDKTTRWFINAFINTGGTYKGKKHHRVCVVWSPFYEYLCKIENGEEQNERKFTKVQIKKMKRMMEFILFQINEKDAYSYGTNSQIAPYMSALFKAASNVALALNEIVINYGEPISKACVDISDCLYDLSWLDYMDNLDRFTNESRMIPVQFSPEGNMTSQDQPPVVNYQAPPVQSVAPPQFPVNQFPPQPAYAPAPAPVAVGASVSFSDVVRGNQTLQASIAAKQMQQMQQMSPQGYPPQNPYQNPWQAQQPLPQQPMYYPVQQGYPQQGYPAQGYPQQPYPQQPYPQQNPAPMQQSPGYGQAFPMRYPT